MIILINMNKFKVNLNKPEFDKCAFSREVSAQLKLVIRLAM